MKFKIFNILFFCCFSLLLANCKPQPSLQTYFVDHQEISDYISMDIPISFLDHNDLVLTKNQQEAINSIKKLNMLGYSLKSGSKDVFTQEVQTIKTILKSEKYNELMRMGNTKNGRIIINYVGDEHAIDELVIFGTSNEFGFAVIRVLGNEMDISKIMDLGPIIKNLDTRGMNLEGFLDFML